MPENVHKAWEAGGTERTALVKLFVDAGLDKDFWFNSRLSKYIFESVGCLLPYVFLIVELLNC